MVQRPDELPLVCVFHRVTGMALRLPRSAALLLARGSAMKALLPPGMDPITYGGYATSIFVAGWAMGGLIFGSLGDRLGRAKCSR